MDIRVRPSSIDTGRSTSISRSIFCVPGLPAGCCNWANSASETGRRPEVDIIRRGFVRFVRDTLKHRQHSRFGVVLGSVIFVDDLERVIGVGTTGAKTVQFALRELIGELVQSGRLRTGLTVAFLVRLCDSYLIGPGVFRRRLFG